MDKGLTERDFQGSSSIAKALSIIEYVGLGGRRSVAEISAHTGLPRSTLLRLIAALLELGFLRRTGHGEYGVALKLWRIGCTAVDYENLHETIVPTLRHVVEKTSETALYAVYDSGRAVYVEKVEGLHPIRAYAAVGSQSPAYASATGKVLLAWRDEAEISRIGASAERLTESTHVGAKVLLRHTAEIRHNGFAVNRGEWRSGVWGVAAPIFGREREPVAAIGVTGPRDRIEPQIEPFSAIVRAAARGLSAHHGAVLSAVGPQDGPVRKRTAIGNTESGRANQPAIANSRSRRPVP